MIRGLLSRCMALTAAALMMTASAAVEDANAQDKGEIVIGLNNWAENIAVSNMWKLLLEEQGYEVELVVGQKSTVYAGVAAGDLDLGLEVWLPETDAPFYERFEDEIKLGNEWYESTGLGLVVPSYVETEAIPGLKAAPETFEYQGRPAIVGIDPGSALMGLTEDAIEVYDLDAYELIPSSGPAMMAALHEAYVNAEPIVVTLWNPHWAFAEYDLKYLADPENVYGEDENIYFMYDPALADRAPEVLDWLNAWQMDDDTLGALMAVINETGDPQAGARQWIEENRPLVESWIS